MHVSDVLTIGAYARVDDAVGYGQCADSAVVEVGEIRTSGQCEDDKTPSVINRVSGDALGDLPHSFAAGTLCGWKFTRCDQFRTGNDATFGAIEYPQIIRGAGA